MKPYYRRGGDELEYRDLGTTSKHRKNKSSTSQSGKIILKKQARNDSKKELGDNKWIIKN